MEAIQYSLEGCRSAEERHAVLEQACLAFVALPTCRRDVRLIAIQVAIPKLSDYVAAPPEDSGKRQRKMPSSSSAARLSGLRRCAEEAERRMNQAVEDAQHLNRWLRRHSCSVTARSSTEESGEKVLPTPSTSATGTHPCVVVAATLSPSTYTDLLVYGGWQTMPLAKSRSPLRRAEIIHVAFTPEGLRNVCDAVVADGAQPTATTAVELDALVQAHQSLLFDLSFAIQERTGTSSNTSRKPVRTSDLQRLFVEVLQAKIHVAKGRTALWLPYNGLVGPCCSDNEDDFAELHAQLAALYTALFGRKDSMGRTHVLRLLTGFGGPATDLLQPLLPCVVKDGEAGPVAALLQTRSLRDAHALLAVVLGADRTDLYNEAVTVCRAIQRRMSCGHHLHLCAHAAAATPMSAKQMEGVMSGVAVFLRNKMRLVRRRRQDAAQMGKRRARILTKHGEGRKRRRAGGALPAARRARVEVPSEPQLEWSEVL